MYVHNCGYIKCVLCWFRQKLTHMAVYNWLKVAKVVPWGTELRGENTVYIWYSSSDNGEDRYVNMYVHTYIKLAI